MKVINNSMRFKTVEITPREASDFLEKNHPNNRKRKDAKIEQYARDNSQGLWKLTHQCIAFDEDGYLVDGQNRLNACVLSNKPMAVTLCFGVPRNSILGVDCGTLRSVSDAAKISGNPLPHGAIAFASVARRMNAGAGKNYLTIQATLAFIKTHHQALDFAFEVLGKNMRGITHSSVRAVVARAWYRRNSRNRLREFAEVMMSGIAVNLKTDTAALRLRNYVLDAQGKRGGKQMHVESAYLRVEAALDAFLNHKNLDKLYRANSELFPIPEDGGGE